MLIYLYRKIRISEYLDEFSTSSPFRSCSVNTLEDEHILFILVLPVSFSVQKHIQVFFYFLLFCVYETLYWTRDPAYYLFYPVV